jgi:hypothetical protein
MPALDDEAVGTAASLRMQMEKHRADPVCASCHSRMDPLGFALENYDAIGRWRSDDGSFPVDARGVLPSGGARRWRRAPPSKLPSLTASVGVPRI